MKNKKYPQKYISLKQELANIDVNNNIDLWMKKVDNLIIEEFKQGKSNKYIIDNLGAIGMPFKEAVEYVNNVYDEIHGIKKEYGGPATTPFRFIMSILIGIIAFFAIMFVALNF